MDQGAKSAISWQELVIEYMEDPGRRIETHKGSRRQGLKRFLGLFQLGCIERKALVPDLWAIKNSHLVASQLL